MTYESTTTLNRIREADPCLDGWTKLLKHLGKTAADDEPLSLLTVLDSNGLDDALWVLSYAMPDDRLARHFQAWCAEQVLPLFENERPNDTRIRDQIAMLRNDNVSEAEREAVWDAAWNAARTVLTKPQAREAALGAAFDDLWEAASASALAAALASSPDADWDDLWEAASSAASAAALVALASSPDADRDAAWVVAWVAARTDQENQLRKMLAGSS